MRTIGRTVALAMALEHREQGRRIAALREQRGLSQEEAARLHGDISYSGYQKWELGGGIRGGNLRRLAEVLDTTIDEIRGRDSDEPNPFSLAAHLDARVEEFRRYSDEMRGDFARVEDKLDTLAAALLAGGAIRPDALDGFRAALARWPEAPAETEPAEPRSARRGRR